MKSPRQLRKIFFRPLTLFILLSASISSVANVAPQAKKIPMTARKQVYNQAVANATADIQHIAKQRKWQDVTSKLNVFIPGEVSQFAACTRPLVTSLPAGDRLILARLRYDIRCEGARRWEITVTVKPNVYVPVLVASHTLMRGQRLQASDVEMKKRNVAMLRDGAITSPDDAIGLTLKRRVRELQPLLPSHLQQPLMVERGQRVLMLAEQDGVEARTIGEALRKGRKGDMIKVRNLSSKTVVTAIVEGPAVVRLLVAG
ncbi:flagella basal body P-ring formation protein FlgA [Izhakiella australiensis]|uniref:Flagella basal body P-ring formation protein FlgA n=1 Tax=Izhakiella australiensis TaxID=1926881 RepID=A0A1S8YIL4_9GAMM|nr:flagellar basal body P-ring formation chaperone FlgA [Izhakiella australiensis]OON38752.1 flagella basal body P-ring formation protein FlgA [Izhakiella australiensis]